MSAKAYLFICVRIYVIKKKVHNPGYYVNINLLTWKILKTINCIKKKKKTFTQIYNKNHKYR